jgi:hypothetical protein
MFDRMAVSKNRANDFPMTQNAEIFGIHALASLLFIVSHAGEGAKSGGPSQTQAIRRMARWRAGARDTVEMADAA